MSKIHGRFYLICILVACSSESSKAGILRKSLNGGVLSGWAERGRASALFQRPETGELSLKVDDRYLPQEGHGVFAMVARSAQESPSYQRLINVAAEDEFPNSRDSNLYHDLQPISQSYCTSSVYHGSGQASSGGEMAMDVGQNEKREYSRIKRKASSYNDGSDDDTIDTNSLRSEGHNKIANTIYYAPCSPGSSRSVSSTRQNHSEIEKRRRDKMNTYITELSAMVPMCHAMSRKLDKLTVLRLTVQHMRNISGAVQTYADGNYKPSFISDLQLKQLIKQAAEGFLFVVGCDRGRILYVSESVSQALNFTKSELLGHSWFDILHPKDVAKVKEQLSSSHLSPRERFIDAKTMLPVKAELPHGSKLISPGARRSFFCRMKCKMDSNPPDDETRRKNPSDKKYREIHCTGYLKPWTMMGFEEEKEVDSDGEACNLSCLVAMGRVIPIPLRPLSFKNFNINIRPLQFISRHAMDGKFLFVDQRATLVLGFLPQELLGSSMYEYYHKDDINHLSEVHKCALQSQQPVKTKVYRFRSKDGVDVHLQSEWKSFRNPWTKESEHLIAKNSRVAVAPEVKDPVEISQQNYDFYKNSKDNEEDMSRFITSNVEASNIGRKIANEVLDEQKKSIESPPSPSQPNLIELQSATVSPSPMLQTQLLLKPIEETCCDEFSSIRDDEVLSSVNEGDGNEVMEIIGDSASQQVTPTDGNDEAAMAVIMSLLEADAGLGGPVDFNGLPWPLP